MNQQSMIADFLKAEPFAVVGATPNRAKYGNRVLRAYIQNRMRVFPIHPTADDVETLRAYKHLAAVPETLGAVSIVTPPPVTERIMRQIVELGVHHVWMQPGAESDAAIQLATGHGIQVIAGGPCILVALGYRDDCREDDALGDRDRPAS